MQNKRHILVFKLRIGPPVYIEATEEVAEMGREQGFKITDPITGEKTHLILREVTADFKRKALIYIYR